MKKTPGIEKLGHTRETLPNTTRRTGRRIPTGQERVGPQRYDDPKETRGSGRANDGIVNKGRVR